MSDNLDDFLRQAAERRARRQQQKSGGSGKSDPLPPTSPPPLSQPPTSQSSASRPRPPVSAPSSTRPTQRPVVADVVSESRPTVGNLRTTLAQRHVESNLEYADERLEQHLNEAFTSDLQSNNSKLRPRTPPPAATASTPAKKLVSSAELKEQLRNPQTLRLAILAQEILKRPYQ